MPQLVEYTNRENITPTDRGTEAYAQQGRRIGAAFNQVAESMRDFGNRTAQNLKGAIADAGDAAVQYQTHRQLNQGIDTYWSLRSSLENDWDETVKGNPDKGIPPADPHDPAIAQRFMEEKLKPALQKWGEAFTTEGAQKWAQGRIDSLTGHFQEKTAADMGTVAKQQIDTSLRAMANAASNSTYNDPSPSNLKHIIEDLRSSIGGMVGSSPYLKGADAARATNELSEKYIEQATKASMMGDIRKSPDPEKTVAERIKDPLYSKYISGGEADGAAKAAKVQSRANDAADRQAELLRRQQADDKVRVDRGKIITKNVKVADPATGKLAVNPNIFDDALDLIQSNPDAPNAAATGESLINWARNLQKEQKEQVVSDSDTMGKLYKGLYDVDNPTTEIQIHDAETRGKLSRSDSQNLTNLRKDIEDAGLHGPVFNATMKAAEEALGLGVVDDGHERVANFMQRFIPEYQKLLRSPGSTAGALNLKDPNSLISKLLDEYRPDANTLQAAHMIKRLFPGEGFTGAVPSAAPGAKPGGTAEPPKPVPAGKYRWNSVTRKMERREE